MLNNMEQIDNTSIFKDVEQMEISYIADGGIKLCNSQWKIVCQCLVQLNISLTYMGYFTSTYAREIKIYVHKQLVHECTTAILFIVT